MFCINGIVAAMSKKDVETRPTVVLNKALQLKDEWLGLWVFLNAVSTCRHSSTRPLKLLGAYASTTNGVACFESSGISIFQNFKDFAMLFGI